MKFEWLKPKSKMTEAEKEEKMLKKGRKKYERDAGKIASETGITKAEAIETDAEIENDARKLLKLGEMEEKEFNRLINNTVKRSVKNGMENDPAYNNPHYFS